ncbi:MAG: hypothetical protein IJU35_07180 [Paludibacteraceae bacterium]|nr:hypothetical protein [Paludibacteraceae bacterium]
MKRRHRIALTILSSVILALLMIWGALHTYANKTVSKKVDALIKERLAQFETVQLSYGEITVGWFSKDIHIKDIYFKTDTVQLDGKKNGVIAQIPEIVFSGIELLKAAESKSLELDKIKFEQPAITVYFGGNDTLNVVRKLNDIKADTLRQKKIDIKKVLEAVSTNSIIIEDGNFRIKNITNNFEAISGKTSLAVYDFRYDLLDSVMSYNDSLYSISSKDFSVTLPDGINKIQLNSFSTENSGNISLQGLKMWCTADKNKIAEKENGKTALWTDIRLHDIRTSPVNIIQLAKSKNLNLKKLTVNGDKAHIYVNSKNNGGKPSKFTLDSLLSKRFSVNIQNTELKLGQLLTEIKLKSGKTMTITLNEVNANLNNLHNKRGQVVNANINFKAQGQGIVNTDMSVKLDHNLEYMLNATVSDLDSHLLRGILQTTLEIKPTYSIGSIATTLKGDINHLTGDLSVTNIHLNTDSIQLNSQHNGAQVDIEELAVKQIDAKFATPQKQITVGEFAIKKPKISANIGEKKTLALKKNKANAKSSPVDISVDVVKIEDAEVGLRNLANQLDLKMGKINASLNEFTFNSATSTLHFNESKYNIALNNLYAMMPDGNLRLSLDKLTTANAGEIVVNNLDMRCPLEKHQLAEKLGKIPATWSALTFSELRTSPINIPQLIKAKAINIDRITGKGDAIAIYRDVRFDAKEDYEMPQDGLRKMTMPLNIKRVDITANKFIVEVAMPTGRVGGMEMTDIKANVKNITNQRGQTMEADMSLKMGKGTGNVKFTMTLDQECSFSVAAEVNNLSASNFDNFLRPLFGVTATCNISHLDTKYTGNKMNAEGDFIMLYNDMKVKAYKGESPYEALAKHVGLVNALGGAVLQQSNPKGKQPAERLHVSSERNPRKEFAVYIVMTMMNGIMQTVLPGFVVKVVNKKIAEKKQAQDSMQVVDKRTERLQQREEHREERQALREKRHQTKGTASEADDEEM